MYRHCGISHAVRGRMMFGRHSITLLTQPFGDGPTQDMIV
jgi:hypothetical protein